MSVGLSRGKPLRRKTPLKAKSGLKRSSRLSRGKGLNPANSERKKKRRASNFGEKAPWIAKQPCDACGAPPPSDPDHHPTRAAGGTKRNLWPLCTECHMERHGVGIETFQKRHGVDATERTKYWDRRWLEHQGERE